MKPHRAPDAGFAMLDAMMAATIAALIASILALSISTAHHGFKRSMARWQALQVAKVALAIGRDRIAAHQPLSGDIQGIAWQIRYGPVASEQTLALIPLTTDARSGKTHVTLNTQELTTVRGPADAR